MIKRSFVYVIAFAFSISMFCQNPEEKKYTLEECLQIALENNLSLKSSKNTAITAKINHKQSKANLLPNVNANYNLGINNGRSIDPFTNDFINQQLTFSNANLSLNTTVFNGFRLLNTLKQQKLNAKAASLEVEQEKQNLILSVTLAYLQVLNNKDLLALNKQRLITTDKQLKIQKDLYDEGRENPADYTDLLGQKSSDETNILSAEIALNNAKLNLRNLLNLNSNVDVSADDFLFSLDKYQFTSEKVYKDALLNLATFKANELRLASAKKGVSVAKAQYIPEISLFGQLNTNYSSAAETFTEIGTTIAETGDFVSINNQNIQVLTNQKLYNAQQINYLDQFDNNFNSVIGISVSVPIFNGFRAKNNVALEKVNVQESLIALEQTQFEIKNAIQQVHFDMEAAFARYQSLKKQVTAFQKSFEINETRFNNGVSNFLAYITSKNNLENAKINVSIAKYDYFLRVKVLEYYRGHSM
ncbi:transporter [Polaribacter reichenbachii]|uniref:Transporter n=1 Tax=Polaribacter reichenbachii TaxID=996801 RepID=A0A1B8TWB5_9FLAO|nr:TolC family protein [Polaribacter reichenbachii]APZ45127.1 transporter [Polaribacter reichenbachii]AUC18989.1 transporter [Polaribacter reichenbachii]OBY63854.1 transporter [Polaribacter reichenbachii]